MAEQTNRGFIAGVRAQDIYDYLSDKENRNSLEEILKAETAARKNLPFWGNAGSRIKSENIDAVFNEIKTSVDCLFFLEQEQYNPEIYAKSFLFKYHKANLGSIILATIGAAYIYPVQIININDAPEAVKDLIQMMINLPENVKDLAQIPLAAGILGLGICLGMSLFGSSLFSDGEYKQDKNTIIGTRSRRNLFKHMLLREYTRAVSTERIRKQPMVYMPFESGFAEGVACSLMSKEDAGEYAIALNVSRKRLKKGINYLQMDRTKFRDITLKLDRDKLPKEHKKGLMGVGYCLFRLAKERHGIEVYKEVYDGKTELLFK